MDTKELDILVAFVALTQHEDYLWDQTLASSSLTLVPLDINKHEDGPVKTAWKSAHKCYWSTDREVLARAVVDLIQSHNDSEGLYGLWLFETANKFGVYVNETSLIATHMRIRMQGALLEHTNCFYDDYLDTPYGIESRRLLDARTAESVRKMTEPTTKGTKTMAFKDMFEADLNVADQVLKGLSGSKITMDYLEGQFNRASKVEGLESKVKELKAAAASRPKTVLPTKYEGVTGSELVGELAWLKATDVFAVTAHAKSAMAFEVPVWTWKDKDGVVMEHPEVPTVDEHYKFDGRLFEAVRAVMNKDFLWIWGHTGAGKSSLIEQIAARLKFPLVTISMDGEITRMDLIGQTKLSEKNGVTITEFVEGVLPNAMSRPSILLMDEMDFVRGDVAYALQTVLNSKSGTLNLLEDGGRVVQRHPWSMIVATANTNGRGDESGRYNYAKRQSSALLNRFTSWMKADYLSKKNEISLLKRVVPELTAQEVESLCDYAAEHRSAFLKDDIEMAMSLRNLVALGQKYIDYKVFLDDDTAAMGRAFDNVITNAASEDDAVAINGIRQRVLGA